MMGKNRKHKCKNCNNYFLPDSRNRTRQKYCAQPSCRKASKAASQRRWLEKPENQDHFKGSVNVKRVQEWRKSHPGYWRRPKKKPEPKVALQDSLPAKPLENNETSAQNALQDILSAQDIVIIGLIAQLTGSALQEDIAGAARSLRQLGSDILNRKSQRQGGSYDVKTPPMSGACKETSGSVQLAGSPPGS